MIEYNREVTSIDAAANTMVQLEREKSEVSLHKERAQRKKCEESLRKEIVHNVPEVARLNSIIQLERQKRGEILSMERAHNASEVARFDSIIQLERQKCEVVLRKERAHNSSEVARRKCNDSASALFYSLLIDISFCCFL